MLSLHPAKRTTFLEKLTRKLIRKRKKYFSKKLFKKLARTKRNVTFAPANRKNGNKYRRRFIASYLKAIYRILFKKEEHVPRHIELTAVPIYRDKYKESKRISRDVDLSRL